ncbi:MAG TPA: NAD(P)/FAD-dependent oxidoreductase [Cellvibrionaceae bacterium]
MRAPKHPALNQLRTSFWQSLPSEALDASLKRRQFIKASLATAALGLTACASQPGSKRKPQIAILGAGMAGLMAGFTLKKHGISTHLYDAAERTGGRVYSQANLLADGLVTEMGGEFIDSNHTTLLGLAKEFKLSLLDTATDTQVDKYDFYFENTHHTVDDLLKALQPFSKSILADINELPDEITYKNLGEARKFDHLSIIDYLTKKGISGWLLALFDSAFTTEYGLDAAEQSAINFLFLFDPSLKAKEFEMFGESDERYKIDGGNQQLVDKLAEQLPNIHLSYEVESISNAGPGYRIAFRNGEDLYFDYIICTMPFTKLRQVNLKIEGISPTKKIAINTLGYGTNAKFFLGFTKRLWRELGFSGQVFSDTAVQLAWDNSQLQPGQAGGLTIFTGGSKSAGMLSNPKPVQAQVYLKQLNKIYPSLQQFYNERFGMFYWPEHPHTLGSYACYKVGQWSAFAGIEAEPVGNLYFAGEHCSAGFQGYMEGAAETGVTAALAVLKAL